MRWTLLWLIVIGPWLCSGCFQGEQIADDEARASLTFPRFFQEFVTLPGDQEKIDRLYMNAWVRYDNLVFVKSPDGFMTQYRLFVQLIGQDGEPVYNQRVERTITTRDFALTTSNVYFDGVSLLFHVKPGLYTAVIEMTDEIDEHRGSRRDQVVVRDLHRPPLSVSDIFFTGEEELSSDRFSFRLPSIGVNSGDVFACFEVIGQAHNGMIRIQHTLLHSFSGSTVAQGTISRQLKGGRARECIRIVPSQLSPSEYKLTVKVDANGITRSVDKSFAIPSGPAPIVPQMVHSSN